MTIYSRSAINRAGEKLAVNIQDNDAAAVLESWRSVHFAPLEILTNFINEKVVWYQDHVSSCPRASDISKRMKRSDAIVQKLNRFKQMKLSRMQDIAGIRLVWNSDCDARQELTDLTNFFTHICQELSDEFYVKKIDNYIDQPAEYGYRSIHIIVECPVNDYGSVPIELQLRTMNQHLWAMAVETITMLYREPLKSNTGDQTWLNFFKLCSAAVSNLEGGAVVSDLTHKTAKEIIDELRLCGNTHTFFTKLGAVHKISKIIADNDKEYDYWLLEIDIENGQSEIRGFFANQFKSANRLYIKEEKDLPDNKQMVLVSTKSFQDIQRLYPSFFLDVAQFNALIAGLCQ